MYKYNKYKNTKTIVDGISFDSKKEAKRYEELKEKEKQGIIKNLELQPVFLLQEKFKYNNKTYREIKYIADFRYEENNKIIIEDVKGIKTDVFKLKLKLLLFKLSSEDKNIDFKII